MHLTPAQSAALKADILNDPGLAAARAANDTQAIAVAYNAPAAPDFYVWRGGVAEAEYTGTAGVDVANGGAATNWSWPAFIGRTNQEQGGWNAMFRSGSADPSKPNVRQGFQDIFSGATAPAPAQRNHMAVMSKRKASRYEKVLAVGTGTFAAPATMAHEGPVTHDEISLILAS
jgi:hypothetical protein